MRVEVGRLAMRRKRGDDATGRRMDKLEQSQNLHDSVSRSKKPHERE